MAQVAVIGAGIAGVTTAYRLLERGHQVTLIDRHGYAAMETSLANGGQLSVSNAEVWNRLSTVLHGLQWLLKADAPLSVNPMPSWQKYSWFAEFLAQIPNYRRNTIETARLALQARRSLMAIAQKEGIAFDHEQRGILHIYRNAASLAHAGEVTKMLAEAGLAREALDNAAIHRLEPTLAGTDFVGGYFTPSDSTGDIHRFTVGLAGVCRRLGATFLTDATVTRLRRTAAGFEVLLANGADLRFDKLVISAGVGSRALAAQFGDRLPIYPVKGYSITVDLADEASQQAAPWVSLLDDDAKIVTSRLGAGRLRVAGTAEFNGYNRDIRADRIRPLVDWTRQLFPAVSTERTTPWAGLRPMMPNMLPMVRESRRAPGLYYNTGHGHLGWTLSAATADLTAALVDGQKQSRSFQTNGVTAAV